MVDLARDEKTGQTDRNQVFGDGDENIFDVQAGHQAFANLITREGSDHGADAAEQRAD